MKKLGEIVTVTMLGKWWREILVTAALLLFGFTSTIAGEQNQSSGRTRAPQNSNLLAEAQSALAQGDPNKAIEMARNAKW